MPDPERFTIGRYKRPEHMPHMIRSEAGGVVFEFTYVHPPNGDCSLGGDKRGLKIVQFSEPSEHAARVAAENTQILCDLCDKPYIPVLPKLEG